MPTVANLAVSVTAQTGDFNRKMQASAGIVRSFGSLVVNMSRRLAAFGTIAGGVTVAGLALATRHAFKLADAVAMTARKVGLATEELIGLRFAAGLAGVKAADLTKFLERMVPKIDTIEGALRRMGVSAGAVATMVRVVEALGVSMNQVGSKKIQDAIAAVRQLWTVIRATSFELAVRLAPAVKFVAGELLHFVVLARVAIVELGKRLTPHILAASERLVQFAKAGANAGSTVPLAFGLIAEAGAKLANSVVFIEAAWHGLNAAVLIVSSNMVAGFEKILGPLRILLVELASGIRAIATILPLPKKQMDAMNEAIDSFQRGVLRSQIAIAGMADVLAADATLAIEKMNKAWEDFASGKAGEDFKATFAEIAERAKAIVADILKLQKIGLKIPDLPSAGALGAGAAAARARTAEFQQISLARVAVQGVNTPGRPQIVSDPQLAITNEHLRQLRTLMTGVGLIR